MEQRDLAEVVAIIEDRQAILFAGWTLMDHLYFAPYDHIKLVAGVALVNDHALLRYVLSHQIRGELGQRSIVKRREDRYAAQALWLHAGLKSVLTESESLLPVPEVCVYAIET